MPLLFKRKAIRFGNGGIAITLPAGWVRFTGIKPRDELDVIVDGAIVIFPRFIGDDKLIEALEEIIALLKARSQNASE
jgi:bifunctional DNA-binding transcriptional regulator/antitoxin component of YhaV-PrlF toxin-antitoxin module